MYQAGGKYWKTAWPIIRKELLSKQKANGSWDSTYGTGMACIILCIPYRYLPILQR
ncbi:MAG: hypothetical protein ACYTGB_00975 [Planctomycetota bacterium]|jgi:hypothetical protein